MTSPLLEVEDLEVHYRTSRKRSFHALKGVSFDIKKGETLGLVGESGSGKSTIGRAILGQTAPSEGSIRLDGEDITHASRRRRRTMGRDIQVVFQDPYSSLNPTRTIGQTLAEPLLTDRSIDRSEVPGRVRDILERVGMPVDTAERYPGQFSGGQRQRIAIARAVIGRPRLVVCDEPVSALDVSVQAQVLNLLNELQAEMGLSMLFISHDLTVVRHVSHRTLVLYQGEIVEEGIATEVNDNPQHPYTRALVSALLVSDPGEQRARRAERRRVRVTARERTA
jgi:ABC-type glutathione transport system ATPase component